MLTTDNRHHLNNNNNPPLNNRAAQPPTAPLAAAPEPELETTEPVGEFGDDFVNNDNWFESTYARNAIAQYVFSEWYEKNLTDSLDNSTADLFGDSIESSSSSNIPLGPAGATGGAFLNAETGGGGSTGAGPGSSHAILGFHNGTGAPAAGLGGVYPAAPRPYFGDAFYSFQTVYWPYHCVICLVICTLGIFANVTNIIVLTRPNMITAVNTILSAMAFSDLIVNITNIPYLLHELSDQTNLTTFFSFQWALYILFQAHTTVTAHTISIWLTCVLSTWRYLVVCRSQSSNQRNWSTGLAKRTVIGVFLIVPVFCIPNYLSFAIVKEVPETNSTIYKVGFSHLADESQFIKTFHFWIFSCLTKLVPCVLLTFFTTVLIRKLLSARERRLRLATYGSTKGGEQDAKTKLPIPNGDTQTRCDSRSKLGKDVLVSEANHRSSSMIYSENNQHNSEPEQDKLRLDEGAMSNGRELNNQNRGTVAVHSGSSCATDGEMVVISCDSSGSGNEPAIGHQQHRIMSQIIVESAANSTTTISTTKAPTTLIASSCDVARHNNQPPQTSDSGLDAAPRIQHDSPRSASTCGALGFYCNQSSDCKSLGKQVDLSMAASQDLSGFGGARRNFVNRSVKCSNAKPTNDGDSKRGSELIISSRGRSVGSTTLSPFQMVRLQAAQRQISQNETTTRLLIAVMIVFLICEFPAGILAALCAILGQDFFENVYQPTGILTDLLALINSSVNFMIYCFMSTQFRITFYQVVLQCPAPNSTSHPLVMSANTQDCNNKTSNDNKERQSCRELNNY